MALFFFIALKLVLLPRASKVMNGKKVHLPRLQPRSQVLYLSRSVKRVGENPGNEVAVASSLITEVGEGEGTQSLFSFFFFFFFFFKFVATKYVLNWRGFPTKTHP